MPTAFSRSMRSLAAEGFGRSLAGLLSATLLLGGWGAWFLLSRVAVYEVTQKARLEVDRAAYPIATPVAGRVDVTHLVVAPNASTSTASGHEPVQIAIERLISNGADALVVAE